MAVRAHSRIASSLGARDAREPLVESRSQRWLWPNQSEAARLLRISKATMSRQRVVSVPYGQERRIPPTVVLELADHFGRRDIGEVMAQLVELGRGRMNDRDELTRLELDLSDYMAVTRAAARAEAAAEGDAWLVEARRRLPPELYALVINSKDAPGGLHAIRFDDEDEG
jgi:hypothetical protein